LNSYITNSQEFHKIILALETDVQFTIRMEQHNDNLGNIKPCLDLYPSLRALSGLVDLGTL